MGRWWVALAGRRACLYLAAALMFERQVERGLVAAIGGQAWLAQAWLAAWWRQAVREEGGIACAEHGGGWHRAWAGVG